MSLLTFSGSNINLVKAHNIQAILLSLLHAGSLSRVQLAKQTSLSTTTITNLISELLKNGIVIEEGTLASDIIRRVGRPRTALRLVPNARLVIGVHIGIGLFRVAIVNLCAEILANTIIYFPIESSSETVLSLIENTIQEIIQTSGVKRETIIGIGVGASGLVNFESGINLVAPNLGWSQVPIRDILESRLDYPVIVDNNVRAMALGEAFFGAGRGIDSMAFVYGRTGVGAGFVFGGQIYRGSNTGAGEIGHTIMVPNSGKLCRCGQYGCLETLISEHVIVEHALQIAAGYPEDILAGLLKNSSDAPPIEIIFEASRQGDKEIKAMLQEKASFLGIALANLVNILNPELILLGGMFAQGADILLRPAAETMRKMAFAGLGEKVRVQTTGFGWRAGVIGASSLALTECFYLNGSVL